MFKEWGMQDTLGDEIKVSVDTLNYVEVDVEFSDGWDDVLMAFDEKKLDDFIAILQEAKEVMFGC